MTGSTLQTMAEWAAELSSVAGREVRYQDETVEEAWASRAVYGAPDWEVEGWITSYLAVATGELAVATDVVERVAGHPPRELAELVSPGPPDSPGPQPRPDRRPQPPPFDHVWQAYRHFARHLRLAKYPLPAIRGRRAAYGA